MSIYRQDLKLIKAEVMDDTDYGGGLPSNEVVIDGQSNNVFADVSDIDATTGRVRLAKLFAAVQTANNEMLQSSRVFVSELPDSDKMSAFVFSATDFGDRRRDAQNKIESYLAFGTKWAGHLLETQLQGQRVIQQSLREDDRVPAIGDALVLVQNEGQQDEFFQYLRVTKVTTEIRTFQLSSNESVERKIATIEISNPLDSNFTGLTVQEFYKNYSTTRRAVLRDARVADAARYYSASKLKQDIVANTTTIARVESVYTQVVPSTQSEINLPNLDPTSRSDALIKASDGTVTYNVTALLSAGQVLHLGAPIYPDTLSFELAGNLLSDVGGEVKDSVGRVYGSINWVAGQISWAADLNLGQQNISLKFVPATALTQISHTDTIQVPETGGGYNYTRVLQNKPARGSVSVSYQVAGQFYTLYDNGSGKLASPVSGLGVGTIDYDNKTLAITTGAIPDALSLMVIAYATDEQTYYYTNSPAEPATITIPYPDAQVFLDSFNITWSDKTANVDVNGIISGDASGYIDYANRLINLKPTTLPPKGTVFNINYEQGDDKTETVTVSANSGSLSFSISGSGSLAANSVYFDLILTGDRYSTSTFDHVIARVRDDGAGNLIIASVDSFGYLGRNSEVVGSIVGTVDYATRAITTDAQVDYSYETKVYTLISGSSGGGSYSSSELISKPHFDTTTTISQVTKSLYLDDTTQDIAVTYRDTSASTTKNLSHTVNELKITLPSISGGQNIISNSLRLKLDNQLIIDRDTKLITDIDPSTGIGQQVGTIDYTDNTALISQWQDDADNTLLIESMATADKPPPIYKLIFRTANAPLQPKSLQITFDAVSEGGQTVGLDDHGFIIGSDYANGYVDQQTGVVALHFGTLVDITSIRYTAVAYDYLPLSSDIIGLDPVRLPSDGRVPFVKPADISVLIGKRTFDLPTHANGDSFTVNDVRLSELNVLDSAGVAVATDDLEINLDAGTFKLINNFNAASYAPPFTAHYTVMDFALVIETDISGRVRVNKTITHDYQVGDLFATVLLFGDKRARAFNVFSQKSWTSEWSDTLIGESAIGQLNVSTNPIQVNNAGTLTDSFALVFTSSTTFKIVSKTRGELAQGTIGNDITLIDPNTQLIEWTIPSGAFASGYAVNNAIRFDTDACSSAFWVGSAIQPHNALSNESYKWGLDFMGNVDREAD